jgi:hypothetical protein
VPFDSGPSFQRGGVSAETGRAVQEYPNPQSEYFTKGISLSDHASSRRFGAADAFVRVLLALYDRNMLITEQGIRLVDPETNWNLPLWFSIMETENVLNPLPGRPGQYSLFRTHHTVNLVAGNSGQDESGE